MTKRIAFKSQPSTAEQWIAGKKAPAEPMKRFTIDVPVELHTRIKVDCARRHLKMADIVRELLEREFPKA
jgi:hypothetical protein